MNKLVDEGCRDPEKWLDLAREYRDQGFLDLARDTLTTFYYIDNVKRKTSQLPITNLYKDRLDLTEELEKVENDILTLFSEEILESEVQNVFPSLLSANAFIPKNKLIKEIKSTLAKVTLTEVNKANDGFLSPLCNMCGNFRVTKSPTSRIPGVSILLGRRIPCRYNCGVFYCSDLCLLKNSPLHQPICKQIPDYIKKVKEFGLCEYRSLLALKVLLRDSTELKELYELDAKDDVDLPLLSELSDFLFITINKISSITYTRREICKIFKIVYSNSYLCNIANIPLDLPFSVIDLCKIWIFSPELHETAGSIKSTVNLSWHKEKVILIPSELAPSDAKPESFRCHSCIIGFCSDCVCTRCGNTSSIHHGRRNVDPADEQDLLFLTSKYAHDSQFILGKMLEYIDLKQIAPFSYSANVIKFLVKSALSLSKLEDNSKLILLTHILGKLCKLIYEAKSAELSASLFSICKKTAYLYYISYGESSLGLLEMREIVSSLGINWIAYPLKCTISDYSLLDDVGKRVYGSSTFTPFSPSCYQEIVSLAFAASRTLISSEDELFDVVRDLVLEFEKLGAIHLPTGMTTLGLALMSRNFSILNSLGLEPATEETPFWYYRTPIPLIVNVLKREVIREIKNADPITLHLSRLINLLENKQEFVDAKTSEMEGLETAMHYAAWTNNIPLIKLLDRYGAIHNPVSILGLTPMDLAASAGHLDVVKYFLTVKNTPISHTTLFLACCSLKVKIVKFILEGKDIIYDEFPEYFDLVWHGIAYTVCQGDSDHFSAKNLSIGRINDGLAVVKTLLDWGFNKVRLLDSRLPSETVSALAGKFLEDMSHGNSQIEYSAIAQSLLCLKHLFQEIEHPT